MSWKIKYCKQNSCAKRGILGIKNKNIGEKHEISSKKSKKEI